MNAKTSEISFYRIEKIKETEIDDSLNDGYSIGFRIDSYEGKTISAASYWSLKELWTLFEGFRDLCAYFALAMNMKNILSFIEENQQLRTQVQRLKDSLLSMTKEYRKYLDNPNILK